MEEPLYFLLPEAKHLGFPHPMCTAPALGWGASLCFTEHLTNTKQRSLDSAKQELFTAHQSTAWLQAAVVSDGSAKKEDIFLLPPEK